MSQDNYYQILEIPSSASNQEIKRSYRRLALKYHPDKNPGNEHADVRFKEVQAAYETLGNPEKRRSYDNRYWFSPGPRRTEFKPETPLSILKESIRLRNYVTSINIFSINHEALNYHICKLISDKNIEILRADGNVKLIQQVILELLQAGDALKFKYLFPVTKKLISAAGEDQESLQIIERYIKKRNRSHTLNQWLPFIVLIITIILCSLIYLSGR